MKFAVLMMVSILSFSCASSTKKDEQIVIAHRSAPGYLPEHTLQGLALAHGWNVDYVEPDIVLTKDNVPVVLHDIHIDTVTNVREVYPKKVRKDRRFYAIDFTLAQLKKLHVHERQNLLTNQSVFPKRFPYEKSSFKIPTLVEYIEMLQGLNKTRGKNVGMYIEFKAPQFHEDSGYDITKVLMNTLSDYGYKTKDDHVIIQCFDPKYLKKIRSEYPTTIPLVQLIGKNEWKESSADYEKMVTPEGIAEVSKYADGIGPSIDHLLETVKDEDEVTYKLTGLMKLARQNGLKVHVYTVRADALPEFAKNIDQLFEILYKNVKVDGVFTDFGDRAMKYLGRAI